jgi:AraC-like DNA-binding protein
VNPVRSAASSADGGGNLDLEEHRDAEADRPGGPRASSAVRRARPQALILPTVLGVDTSGRSDVLRARVGVLQRQRYPGSFLTNTVPSRQSVITPELIASHRLRWPDASVRCPATGATMAMTMPATAVNPPSSSDSRAGSPNAELDRYVLKTKGRRHGVERRERPVPGVLRGDGTAGGRGSAGHATQVSVRIRQVVTSVRGDPQGPRLCRAPPLFPEGQPKWLVYLRNVDSGELAHLRRARDLLDREYAKPLNVPLMARAALMSPSHFARRFREAYGETPYGYLQTRRVERAMALLRHGDLSVTDVCMAVGFTSLGSFSSTFTRLVGEPPSAYRARDHSRFTSVPPCIARAWTRPSRNGEARRAVPA